MASSRNARLASSEPGGSSASRFGFERPLWWPGAAKFSSSAAGSHPGFDPGTARHAPGPWTQSARRRQTRRPNQHQRDRDHGNHGPGTRRRDRAPSASDTAGQVSTIRSITLICGVGVRALRALPSPRVRARRLVQWRRALSAGRRLPAEAAFRHMYSASVMASRLPVRGVACSSGSPIGPLCLVQPGISRANLLALVMDGRRRDAKTRFRARNGQSRRKRSDFFSFAAVRMAEKRPARVRGIISSRLSWISARRRS